MSLSKNVKKFYKTYFEYKKKYNYSQKFLDIEKDLFNDVNDIKPDNQGKDAIDPKKETDITNFLYKLENYNTPKNRKYIDIGKQGKKYWNKYKAELEKDKKECENNTELDFFKNEK